MARPSGAFQRMTSVRPSGAWTACATVCTRLTCVAANGWRRATYASGALSDEATANPNAVASRLSVAPLGLRSGGVTKADGPPSTGSVEMRAIVP